MIIINGERWKLAIVSSSHPILRRNDGSWTLGTCDKNTRTIFIARGLGANKFKKVLCHELTHASMFSYNIYLPKEQEEEIADFIATYGEEIVNITNIIFHKIKK